MPVVAPMPFSLNKFTPTHTVAMLYIVPVTPVLHSDMSNSLNAALKVAISPAGGKSVELESSEGKPASHGPASAQLP